MFIIAVWQGKSRIVELVRMWTVKDALKRPDLQEMNRNYLEMKLKQSIMVIWGLILKTFQICF